MYDVAGFPTILYFNYGKNEQKYLGDRSQDAFINFMNDPVRGLAEFAQGHFQINVLHLLNRHNLKIEIRMRTKSKKLMSIKVGMFQVGIW